MRFVTLFKKILLIYDIALTVLNFFIIGKFYTNPKGNVIILLKLMRGNVNMKEYKILVVDDDENIRNVIIALLKNENYIVFSASNGVDALNLLDSTFDLVILDVMMPKKDGISTCIDIRAKYIVPILFLTAKNTEYDKFIGFSVGGDDYLEKPFSRIELLARASSLLRRYRIYQNREKQQEEYIYIKDLKIDKNTARVFKDNIEILLTNIEYKLLMLFSKNPNRIFTLENIYEAIWGEEYDCSVNSLIVVHIRNLRKKLGDTSQGAKYIKNIWGRGYCIEVEQK